MSKTATNAKLRAIAQDTIRMAIERNGYDRDAIQDEYPFDSRQGRSIQIWDEELDEQLKPRTAIQHKSIVEQATLFSKPEHAPDRSAVYNAF